MATTEEEMSMDSETSETVSILRGPNGNDRRAVCRVFASRDEALEKAAEYNVDDGEGVWTVETWQVTPTKGPR